MLGEAQGIRNNKQPDPNIPIKRVHLRPRISKQKPEVIKVNIPGIAEAY